MHIVVMVIRISKNDSMFSGFACDVNISSSKKFSDQIVNNLPLIIFGYDRCAVFTAFSEFLAWSLIRLKISVWIMASSVNPDTNDIPVVPFVCLYVLNFELEICLYTCADGSNWVFTFGFCVFAKFVLLMWRRDRFWFN